MSEPPPPESGERAIIPLANPAASFRSRYAEITGAFERVLDSGRYILAGEVRAFETEFAEYIGANHVMGVASGTDAVALALRSVGIAAGDEVVTVSHSAVATVAAIEQMGGVPVFSDICPVSRCLDPQHLRHGIGPRTRAVVVVHIYGQPADMAGIMEVAGAHGLKVIEDCAQAHGGTIGGQHVGVFGDAAAFSFYPTKNLAAMGDGGAVVLKDQAHYERALALRQYGWDARRSSQFAGVNSRLDELQAAILRVMLTSLNQDIERRRAIAAAYDEVLGRVGVAGPAHVLNTEHAMHLYVVEDDARDRLAEELRTLGVSTGRHYPLAIHQMPAYRGRVRGGDRLPETERLYSRCLSLPMFPEMTPAQLEHVCSALEAACAELKRS
jgi:dTDP-4-amino-4,6-dideoxygalactose transaminase